MFYKFAAFISYTIFALAPLVIADYLKKQHKKLMLELRKPGDYGTYSFIFITYENRHCRSHLMKNIVCSDQCACMHLATILRFLESARSNISMCVCILTFIEIHEVLIRAHNKRVVVRYIGDAEMLRNTSARKDYLKKAGIPIKAQPEDFWLHHKFCLVDEYTEDAKLMFGSLNPTCQGLTTNWDMAVFTTDKKVIGRFHEEFEYLWNEFDYV